VEAVTEDDVRTPAFAHLRSHHGDFLDDDVAAKALTLAIIAAPR